MADITDASNIIQNGFMLWDQKSTAPLNLTYTFLDSYPSYYKTSIFDLTPGQFHHLLFGNPLKAQTMVTITVNIRERNNGR